ncbi:hypothetical protein DIPPA_35758 [Diplonema papillatum]|nr:hypothetical protein DIPPA_35758 [Diplonema papillatum]
MAVLADGSWVYDWDDQGLLFFRETVTRRTVRDLRAEMAQILAEERMAAALDESNRMSFADLMAASRSYPTQATQARSPGVQPSSPPPPASGHERSPTTVPQTPPNQPTSPHTPLPKESPAWQLEEGASALSPPEDGEAEVTPPPPATPDGAGDDHAGGQPAVVHDYRRGPPTPDFNSMPLGETACVFTATEELSLLNQELQADDDQIDFAPIVRTLPRRTKYNAREKWGPIEYMTDENRSAAELTVQRAQFQRQMEDSLLRIRAGHNEAMQDLAPLARPPPEELGPYYPQESRLGPHIAASSLAASPHTQGASYTRLDEPASPWRNPVSAIRLRRTAPSQYVLSPNEEHLTYVSA